MDFTLTTLGVTALPCVFSRKRSLVDQDQQVVTSVSTSSSRSCSSSSSDVPLHQLFVGHLVASLEKEQQHHVHDKEDDDTATTLSTSTSSEEDDSFKMVTFATPLVTQVWTRPRTTRDQMYDLHYNEHDYLDFKVEYMTGKGRDRKVSFVGGNVVTSVQEFPETAPEQLPDLYYSEMELQQFLDDFVHSLHQP